MFDPRPCFINIGMGGGFVKPFLFSENADTDWHRSSMEIKLTRSNLEHSIVLHGFANRVTDRRT